MIIDRSVIQQVQKVAQLDLRTLAQVLLGEPVARSTRNVWRLSALSLGVQIPPDFFPSDEDEAG